MRNYDLYLIYQSNSLDPETSWTRKLEWKNQQTLSQTILSNNSFKRLNTPFFISIALNTAVSLRLLISSYVT